MTATIESVRDAEGADLMALLNAQQARKIDVVLDAKDVNFVDGNLVIKDVEPVPDDNGVTTVDGTYKPTRKFDDDLAGRLEIGTTYMRRLRYGKKNSRGEHKPETARLDLYDLNANGLLHGRKGTLSAKGLQKAIDAQPDKADLLDDDYKIRPISPDSRRFLARLFRGDETGTGIARAFLSDSYGRMDNLDAFMAMLQGIVEAGLDPNDLRIHGDLTESRMYVHVEAPQIMAMAPELLANYRSPFEIGAEASRRQTRGYSLEERIELGRQFRERGHGDGNHSGFYEPGQEPLVHAGLRLINSETGDAKWSIAGVFTLLRCSNGLTFTKDAFKQVHLGGKKDEGHMVWSADTQSKELAYVTAQTKDVVAKVLSVGWLNDKIQQVTEKANTPITPEKVEVLTSALKFSDEDRAGILRHFNMGGQHTSGGVMQAFTSYSQTLADPDASHALDDLALNALEMAYATS